MKAEGDGAEDDATDGAPAVEDEDYFDAKEGGDKVDAANCTSAASVSSAQEAEDRELAMRLTLEAMGLAPTRDNFALLAAQLTHDFGTPFTSRH